MKGMIFRGSQDQVFFHMILDNTHQLLNSQGPKLRLKRIINLIIHSNPITVRIKDINGRIGSIIF